VTSPFPGAPPLVLSSYTLGSRVSFADRVAAAAAAGFEGIGLRIENYLDARAAGLDDATMRARAAEAGVPVLEVEYLTGWGRPEGRDPEQRAKEAALFAMARTFEVGHVNAGLLELLPEDLVIPAFAELCDRAGPDLLVALEPMPYSGVRDLPAAWRVVREAGRPNGALLVDLWHWARAGTSAADLATVPPERIVSVQLCDVRPTPLRPLRAESLGHRLPPGEGAGDAVGVVRALLGHGVTPRIVAVEVISDALLARGPGYAARTAADAARDVLRRAASTGIP
jgi:sugar phosphate isomerase/epimerase